MKLFLFIQRQAPKSDTEMTAHKGGLDSLALIMVSKQHVSQGLSLSREFQMGRIAAGPRDGGKSKGLDSVLHAQTSSLTPQTDRSLVDMAPREQTQPWAPSDEAC